MPNPHEYDEVANSAVKMLGTWMHIFFHIFICSSLVAGIHTRLQVRFILGEEKGADETYTDRFQDSPLILWSRISKAGRSKDVCSIVHHKTSTVSLDNSSDYSYGLCIFVQIEGRRTVRIWGRCGAHGLQGHCWNVFLRVRQACKVNACFQNPGKHPEGNYFLPSGGQPSLNPYTILGPRGAVATKGKDVQW